VSKIPKIWEIEVADKDPVDLGLLGDIAHNSGITGVVTRVERSRKYVIQGVGRDLEVGEVERIATKLTDPVAQTFSYDGGILKPGDGNSVIEVVPHRAVIRPDDLTVSTSIQRDMGITTPVEVKISDIYRITGNISPDDRQKLCDRLLVVSTVQRVRQPGEDPFMHVPDYQFQKVDVPIIGADDTALMDLSRRGELALNGGEMRRLEEYFSRLGRNPTDIELETFAQTWSEHCQHKTFRGDTIYTWEDGSGRTHTRKLHLIDGIKQPLSKLKPPWVFSAFKDNAGGMMLDGRYVVWFKVETHNHPSAIEPYGGAATGIGGVIRDVLGAESGAKPIANTDVFCFAPPDYPFEELPAGALHPRRLRKYVHLGVRDYGNRMGIPTISGDLRYHEDYVGNPVVYCGTVGTSLASSRKMPIMPGDCIVLTGGGTGRDGMHGVTFASKELTSDSEKESMSSVQVGSPIEEKRTADALLTARDRGLYKDITDCGGGGLASAVGEKLAENGAVVDLDLVPLKYKGLSYPEIWISEAQERMVVISSPDKVEEFLNLCKERNVRATVIGRATSDRRLVLRYGGQVVGDMDMEFLHTVPPGQKTAYWKRPVHEEPHLAELTDYTGPLKELLGSLRICSKGDIVRQYDQKVQGNTISGPFCGINDDGPSDAAILAPNPRSRKGVIIACGINPQYGFIDPYHMASSSIDEVLRQIISVGGNLDQVALLDNFSWGDPGKPDRLGAIVRAVMGCSYAATAYGTPFISGKDSFYNEYRTKDGREVCIPPTLLISAMGVMPDVRRALSMDLKEPGNMIYIVGETRPELGGSAYYEKMGYIGNSVPTTRGIEHRKELMQALGRATYNRLVRSCHDCSDGGLAVAAAEMAFAGGLGMELDLRRVPYKGERRDDNVLFSESNTRWVVEIEGRNYRKFERAMANYPFGYLGRVIPDGTFVVNGINGDHVIHADLADLKRVWQGASR
jgi:phosphoribosylformylglycinamidine synthase